MAGLLLSVAAASAFAWWDEGFGIRSQFSLNTGPAGVTLVEPINGAAVPLRLHPGNFDFVAAKPDGSDLRVLAADDQTPLPFQVERFDGAGELAVVWVQVPVVAPGSSANRVFVYAGHAGTSALPAATVVDAGSAATFRFADAATALRDVAGVFGGSGPATLEPNGLIGASLRLDGQVPVEIAPGDRLRVASGAPYSVSLWARPNSGSGIVFNQGPLRLALQGTQAVLTLGSQQVRGGELPPATWVHLGVTVGSGQLTLYVNGVQAAQATLQAAPPAIEGPVRLGEGFAGLLDELQLATQLRSAEWMRFTRAAQGADAQLVASLLQREGQVADADKEGGHGGYIGILVKNLTVDAWVVIVICGLMLVLSIWVMAVKAVLVQRLDRSNRAFLQAFRAATDPISSAGAQTHAASSLARLYDAGVVQLRKRGVGDKGSPPLSGASLDAVKAAVDADLVRENQRMNSLMVLLTIAISGGPFLGLLGTVVGVMITFAAIAAAGDVNVNAIAPGIAAALLATVAGLAVAIPALFGYNYLASRMKNISADMQIFVDEFVTRVAESYGQR